jgi:hypothetical protein
VGFERDAIFDLQCTSIKFIISRSPCEKNSALWMLQHRLCSLDLVADRFSSLEVLFSTEPKGFHSSIHSTVLSGLLLEPT